jgi:hypothetical protein
MFRREKSTVLFLQNQESEDMARTSNFAKYERHYNEFKETTKA